MKNLLKIAALSLVLSGGLITSCTEQPINENEPVQTDPGDSTNSGQTPPTDPDNGEG